VLFRALRIDFSSRAAYIASFVGTVLIGLGDECIQWVLPQRFFELKDVQLNALSGGLGLLILRFVVQPAEEGVGEGTERRPEERTESDGHHTFPE
jgi:glycopeptide antibiotics resistance protein